jgi:transposase
LSEFRDRLLEHEAVEQILDTMLAQFIQAGLLNGGGKQRTDSTYVLASVRALNRLELVGRALQAALDAIAEIEPGWLQEWVAPDWYERYGQLLTEFRLPQKSTERDALAVQIGWDGLALLDKVALRSKPPPDVRDLAAVQRLRQIWIQQYVIIEDTLRWRTREEMPPAARLIQSPFDVEARYSRKREKEWMGYKVHFTETCGDNLPHLVTNIRTTNATEQDFDSLQPIHQALKERNCAPAEHLVDMGYTSGPLLADSRTDYGIELVAPLVEKHPWQQETGYEMDAFTIDWDKHQIICPQGKASYPWTLREHRRNHELIRVKFPAAECRPCPVHELCTKHHRRTVSFHEQAIFEAVQQRKKEQHTEEFRQRYRKRAGIEGTISQGVFALGMRRSRYRGQNKSHLQFVLTAAAMNVSRAINWLNEIPSKTTQLTRFGRLAAA